MAYYKQTFTNAYLQDVGVHFLQKENLTSTGFATLNYKKGLLIDASGQDFYRNSQTFNNDCGDVTTTYDSAHSVTGLKLGFAGLNLQWGRVNYAHSFSYKTEMSGVYTLIGALFLNPSPLKVVRNTEGSSWFAFGVLNGYVIDKQKCEKFKEEEKKNDINFFGLTIQG